MNNEQKLERARQLRREALLLEDDVKSSTPCCSYCDKLVVNGQRSPRVYRCEAFSQEMPVEFIQVRGNGCDQFFYDSIPF